MSQSKVEYELKEALLNTGILQPFSSKSHGSRIEVLCRPVLGQEAAWLIVVKKLLQAFPEPEKAAESQFSVFLASQFLLKENKLVKGWYLKLEGKNTKELKEKTPEVVAILAKAKPDLTPVIRQPAPVALSAYHRPLPPGVHPSKKVQLARNAPQAPTGGPKPKVTSKRTVDASGRVTTTFEMPLPGVRGQLNPPSDKGGVLNLGEVPHVLRGRSS